MKHANQVFILPQQPAPDDTRPRNGFGYLLGFGQAYAAHYAELDRQAERRRREAVKRRRQARGRNAAVIGLGARAKPQAEPGRSRSAGTRRVASGRNSAPGRSRKPSQGAPDVAAATCTTRTTRTTSRSLHNRYNPNPPWPRPARPARQALQPCKKRFIGIFQNPKPHTFNG